MKKQWIILSIIILMYLPVSIDATVLHVAIPTLSQELLATNNQLLWIIDIYSLIMVGFLLPMGALGDRIGYKRLAIYGSLLFGLASLGAALSSSTLFLIVSRALSGIGAAMILPATLSGVRQTFTNEYQRNLALGIWVTVGTAGAMIGPLVGGLLLEYFYWGSVFLINLPVSLLVILLTSFLVPTQAIQHKQPLYFIQAVELTLSLLMIIYSIKNLIQPDTSWLLSAVLGGIGFILLYRFIRKQLSMPVPMIDIRLLMNKPVLLGFIMAFFAMMAIVGFELVMSQELQFVLGKSPLEAALFAVPLMVASGVCGPIAGLLSDKFSQRFVACLGTLMSAAGFWQLSVIDIETQPYLAALAMVVLGFGAAAVFFSATSTIMSSAPVEKATAAGAMEGLAYELGAGLGVAIFGLTLAGLYGSFIVLPNGFDPMLAKKAMASIGQAIQIAPEMNPIMSNQLIDAAKIAHSTGLTIVLKMSSIIFLALTLPIWLTRTK